MKAPHVLFLCLLLAAVPSALHAQTTGECGSQQFFSDNPGCTASTRGFKCIELDISHSIDKDGKEFIYSWNFGDGNTHEGYLTEYCYGKYGSYTITLDLLDPVSKVVIRNELTTQLTLLPKVDYETDTVGERGVAFRYNRKLMPGVDVDKVFWRFGDQYKCGESLLHTFDRDGLHIIEVGVLGRQEGQNFSGCTLMAVFIQPKP